MTAPGTATAARGSCFAFYALRLTSQLGQAMAYASLLYLGGSSGEAALGLSAVLIGMMAGAVLFGVPGGALADAVGPPRALLLGAILRGAAIALALVLPHEPPAILAVAFVYSAVSQLFSPAEMAMLRLLGAHPARGHALLLALQFGAHGAGLGLASALIVAGHVDAALAAASSLYGVVVLLAARLQGVPRPEPVGTRRPSLRPLAAIVRTRRSAAEAAAVLVYNDLATKCLAVTAPVYIFDGLGLRGISLAWLGVPAALGVLAGSIWAMRTPSAERMLRGMRTLLLATALALGALAGLAEGPLPSLPWSADTSLLPISGASLLLGAAFGAFPIGGRAVLSSTLPAFVQARAFAAQASLSDLVVIGPLAGTGAGVAALGPRLAFAAVAGIALLLFLVLEYGGALVQWARPVLSARRSSAPVQS